jgi:hypothetical protein
MSITYSKVNVEFTRGPEGKKRIYLYSFFILGAGWGGWSMPHPDGCTRGKEKLYPFCGKLDGLQGLSGRIPPTGFDPRNVKFVASRYTG